MSALHAMRRSLVTAMLAMSARALVRTVQPLSRLEARSFASSGGKYRATRRRATPTMGLRAPAPTRSRGRARPSPPDARAHRPRAHPTRRLPRRGRPGVQQREIVKLPPMNEEIRAPEVRVVVDQGKEPDEVLGVISREEALDRAAELGARRRRVRARPVARRRRARPRRWTSCASRRSRTRRSARSSTTARCATSRRGRRRTRRRRRRRTRSRR